MQFKGIFGDNGLYYTYVGRPKDCGEFHPDFAVERTDSETRALHQLTKSQQAFYPIL